MAIRDFFRGNVLGMVAIFIALSGTAWAAAEIGANDIKDNAVRSKHIKDGQVAGGDLAANAINSERRTVNFAFSNTPGNFTMGEVEVFCPFSGYTATGGGATVSNDWAVLHSSRPITRADGLFEGWAVRYRNVHSTPESGTGQVYVVCSSR